MALGQPLRYTVIGHIPDRNGRRLPIVGEVPFEVEDRVLEEMPTGEGNRVADREAQDRERELRREV